MSKPKPTQSAAAPAAAPSAPAALEEQVPLGITMDVACDAYVAHDDVEPDPEQPRTDADDELRASIAARGIQEPIIVRPHPTQPEKWMIVNGERRWRGSAGVQAQIPVNIRYDLENAGDRLLIQLVTNAHRPMSPLDEARAFQRIMTEKGWSQNQLATELGVPRSTVGDRVALADAPAPFLPLFEKGELSAAAAPIVRKYAGVPERVLKEAIARARENFEWEDAVRDKRAVPLGDVKEILADEILPELFALDHSRDVAARYQGATVKIDGALYAVDRDEALRIRQEIDAEARAKEKKKTAAAPTGSPVMTRQEDDYQRRERERRAAEAKKLKQKRDEREAQFAAIAAALPTALDAAWLLFVIHWLTHEMQNDFCRAACHVLGLEPAKGKRNGYVSTDFRCRAACHVLGLEPAKGKRNGYVSTDFRAPIVEHAEGLDAAGRGQLIVQLLLMHDTYVGPYSTGGKPERFEEAAHLLGLDLKAATKGEARPTNPIAEPAKTIGEQFSHFVTTMLKGKEREKTLARMSNDFVTWHLQRCREQLAKYDDPNIQPSLPGETRERAFLHDLDRNTVVADLALLEQAARRRGLGEFAAADADEDLQEDEPMYDEDLDEEIAAADAEEALEDVEDEELEEAGTDA